MIALALASLILLIMLSRSKKSSLALMKSTVLSLAATTFGLMMVIGNTGGKIRRPELRGDVVKNSTEKHIEHHDKD
jgi:hypothetical protein